MGARITKDAEKQSDAPDTSVNRAHRPLAASTPMIDGLEDNLELADVTILQVIAPRALDFVTNHRLGSGFRETVVPASTVVPAPPPPCGDPPLSEM